MAVEPPEWPSVTRRMRRDRMFRQLLGLAILIAVGVGVAIAIGSGKSSGTGDSALSSVATSTKQTVATAPPPKPHGRTPSQRATAPIARVVDVPTRCAAVQVSTIDPVYAAYSYRTGVGCSEVSTDAVSVLQHTNHGWKVVGRGCAGVNGRIPGAIYKELAGPLCGL